LAHLLVYTAVFNVPWYHWYYAPQLVAMAVLAALAVDYALPERWTTQSVRSRPLASGVAVLGLVSLVMGATQVSSGYRFYNYDEAAHWINENTPEDATVAISEFGLFGWQVDRRLIDYVGLLHERDLEGIRNGDLSEWLGREQPDYWVTRNPPLRDWETDAISEPWFPDAYRPVHEIDTVDDPVRLRIYERYRSVEDARELSEPT